MDCSKLDQVLDPRMAWNQVNARDLHETVLRLAK
jgi:hypothetical protein